MNAAVRKVKYIRTRECFSSSRLCGQSLNSPERGRDSVIGLKTFSNNPDENQRHKASGTREYPSSKGEW